MNTHPLHRSGRALPVSFLLLCLASPGALAAEPPAAEAEATAAVEELVELDEVLVRGRITANRIITAENRVFRLYNKLNKEDGFDVHCGYVGIYPSSMIQKRICGPEFMMDLLPRAHFGMGSSGSCSSGFGMNGESPGGVYAIASCRAQASMFSGGSFSSAPFVSMQNVPLGPVPVSMPVARATPAVDRAAFIAHMGRLLYEDPQLRDLSDDLAAMYLEMDRIQTHYEKLREAKRALRRAEQAAARARKAERLRTGELLPADLRGPGPRG